MAPRTTSKPAAKTAKRTSAAKGGKKPGGKTKAGTPASKRTSSAAADRKREAYVEYTEELADAICGHVVEGMSVRAICALPGMPSKSGFFKWLGERDDFRLKYEAATRERAQSRYESIDEVIAAVKAKKIDPRSARVVIDAIKWQCAIERPDRYGPVSRHELTGKNGGPLQTQSMPAADMTPEQRLEEMRSLVKQHPELFAQLASSNPT